METQRQRSTIFRVEGAFDLPAARLVENLLRRTAAGDEVRVDFSRVRQFHDFGVALLAQALVKNAGVHVRLEGLRMHQVRLLRYFGVDADAFRQGPRAAATHAGR